MRSAKLPEYIQVRSGVFYVRMAVPLDLRGSVGKAELKRSLNTRSPTEAVQLAPHVVAHFQRQIQQARSKCTPVHTTVTELPIEDAKQFVRQRLSIMQALPDQSRARGRQFLSGQGGGERSRRLNDNRELLAFYEEIENGDQWDHWRVALGRSAVQTYEQEHQVRVAHQSVAHGVLSDFGAQAQIEHVRRAIHRDENPHVTTPAPDSGSALAGNDAGQTLGQLLKAYRGDKEQTWKPSSAEAFCKVERLLCGWFGAERSIQSISRNDFRELFHALPRIPSGYTRFKAFHGMPVRQVIEAADAMSEPPCA